MQLNYDIVAIVIIVFSIIFGYARGFYKQLKTTLAILVPFLIIIFAHSVVVLIADKLNVIDAILVKIADIFAFFTLITIEDLKLIVIYLVIFLIVGLLVHLIVSIFSPSRRKKVITFKSKTSKFIAAGLGLLRGVALVVIVLFVIKEITIINFSSPLTKALLDIITPILGDFTV